MADAEPIVPEHFLAYASRGESWQTWLEALPRLARDLLEEWRLTPDGAVATGECAIVIPVTTEDAEPAMLKVGYPHEEAEFEHLALRAWAGNGAVRLLRADPRRYALLLERASLTDLTSIPVLDACEIVAGLYPRLHIAAPPQLKRLSSLAGQWADELTALPSNSALPRRYVEQAASLTRDFAADAATDGRLIHSDFHYFNVLAADREDWLAIDPKPLSGDPHHEIAPLLWNRWDEIEASHDARTAIRERFHTVIDAAGFDEARARDWVVVRMVVNAMWSVQEYGESHPSGRAPMSDEDREWITQCLTIAKAVQD